MLCDILPFYNNKSMNEFTRRQLKFYSASRSMDEQFDYHGLETEETIKLRDEIKKFFLYFL